MRMIIEHRGRVPAQNPPSGASSNSMAAEGQKEKEQMTATTLGAVLLCAVFDPSRPSSVEGVYSLIKGLRGTDPMRALSELIVLRAVLVEYALMVQLGKGPLTEAVLHAFWSAFATMGKADQAWASFYQNFQDNADAYRSAFQAGNPFMALGTVFSNRLDGDIETMTRGGVECVAYLGFISDAIKKARDSFTIVFNEDRQEAPRDLPKPPGERPYTPLTKEQWEKWVKDHEPS